MEVVSPDFCASFGISMLCDVDCGDKNAADIKCLLPSVTLPSGVPIFQVALDIVSREKSEENAYAEYDYTIRGSIATVNKVDSTVERVYLYLSAEFDSMAFIDPELDWMRFIDGELEKFICNKHLNRTKTFSQSGVCDRCDIIHLEFRFDISAIHSAYPYEMCDQLMAGEMWPENNALKLPDIEFEVSGVTLNAHRAIICARSPVFAAMFANGMLESRTGRVHITDVSVETFRLFLQFLYTGSLDESCFDEKLKYYADKYQVKTLSDLCGGLLVQQDSEKCKDFTRSAARKSDREEVRFLSGPVNFAEYVVIEFVLESAQVGSNEFRFRNIVMEVLLRSDLSMSFFCWNPKAIGLDIYCVHYVRDGHVCWKPMIPHNGPSESYSYGFPYFNAKGSFPAKSRIQFRVLFREAAEKYKFQLMDRLRGTQLWAAATDRRFTDVEFVVAGQSFHAHQAIVAARCPLYQCLDRENYARHGKYEVLDCNPSLFEQLLFFVYTGTLQAPADSEQLLYLAKKYGIVTLQEICELALKGSFKSFNEEDVLSMHL